MSSNNNNKDIGNSHAIMSLIDENKDAIPSGLYLNLCNLLKKQNDDEKKEYRFYKVTYVYSLPTQKGSSFWEMSLCVGNEILKLTDHEYRNIQIELESKGCSYQSRERLSQSGICHSYVRTINCDDCEEEVDANISLISRSCIVKIELA